MAKYKTGILGPFRGTVGTITGSKWKGIDYMRSRSGPNKSSSPAQQVQRAKFSLVIKFLSSMRSLLNSCFTENSGRMTGSNSALGYTLQHAVTGAYPNLAIDYSQALVTRGNLPNADNIVAAAVAGNNIHFTWTNNAGRGIATGNDRSILVAYSKNLNKAIYTMQGAVRSAETATLSVPAFTGERVQVWLAFISESGKAVADSFYAGELTIS